MTYQELRSVGFPVFVLVDEVPELLAPLFARGHRQALVDSRAGLQRQVRELVLRQLLVPVAV